MTLLRRFWAGWKAFGHVLGQIQTAVLLSIIYHIAIGPISIIGCLLRQPFLELRARERTSYADQLTSVSTTLERARKQF